MVTGDVDRLPVAPPGRIPDRRPTVEAVAKRRRLERRKGEPRTRLTQGLIDQLATSLTLGTPIGLALDYCGIDRETMRQWMMTGDRAARKRWNDRTQLERRCVVLRDEVRKAQGKAGTNAHLALAKAAGMVSTPVTSRVITQRIVAGKDPITVDGNGQVSGGIIEEVTVETKEHAPEWRAAVAIAKYRFPEDMGEPTIDLTDTQQGTGVSPSVFYDRLQQIKRERIEAGLDEPIEATATLTPPPETPGALT